MKLYERFGDSGFHTSIVTTFGVDFDAYENIAVARFRSAGSRNNMLVVDRRMLAFALSTDSNLPAEAGRQYSISGASARGVFHPKLILQFGRSQGRLIVASANATATGFAGNLELVGIVECDHSESPEQQLIASAWEYVSRFIDVKQKALSHQLWWMNQRTPWLQTASPATSPIQLSDGTFASFLATNGESGILQRFIGLTAEDTIERLIVLSPYWDEDLAALNELQEQLQPRETLLLVQAKNALLPITPLASLKNTRILDIGPQHMGRFIHAKLLLAQGVNFEHALFGSANCTTAALGRLDFNGSNHEACLYRRVGVGVISSAIHLEKLIANAESTSASTLPAYSPAEEVPLTELDRNDPGTFECSYDKLTWRPTSRFNSDEVMIELFSGGRASLSCSLEPILSGEEDERFFVMSGLTERPVFARVVDSYGTPSGFAIVTLTDALQGEIREAGQPTIESAVLKLDIETEEGLWLLEILEDFEFAAHGDRISNPRKKRVNVNTNIPEPHFKQLDYESFVATCRLRNSARSTVTRNSLAGTPLSSVRAFLNRVLDISDIDDKKVESDDGRFFENAFDLGDDVEDGQDAVEHGEVFGKKDGDITRTDDPKNNKVIRMKGQNRKKIESAVGEFIVRVCDVSKNGALTSVELLRLRCMLAIVFVAGLPLRHRKKEQDSEQSILQVLPATGQEPTWPRLLGQLLFSVFGGPHPPISRLKVEDIHDRIPDDFIECWAYCFWAIHARLIATPENSFHQDLLQRIYELSRLPQEDRQCERLVTVMSRLDDRFAKRLGLPEGTILKAHLSFS